MTGRSKGESDMNAATSAKVARVLDKRMRRRESLVGSIVTHQDDMETLQRLARQVRKLDAAARHEINRIMTREG
jgi:hypothetical protein